VIAETSANFDRRATEGDVETVEARRPSVLLTLPVNPVVTASAYKAAARQGTKIVLLSNVPQGMKQGRDYVDVVTDDLFQMGKRAADALAAAVGHRGTGRVLLSRRQLLCRQSARPGVPQDHHGQLPESRGRGKAGNRRSEQGSGPGERGPGKEPEDLRRLRHVLAAGRGRGVLAALRANGNTTTKVVSLDLDEPLALDMAKGGNTFALIADRAYELGQAMGKSAAYGLLGKKAPAFVVVPALTIRRSNLVRATASRSNRNPPASVMKALGK